MKQDYFIVVLAHSLHGRLRRVHIPQKFVYGVLMLAVFGLMSLVGVVSSYGRMALKVSNYNSLRNEAENLRARYARLQRTVNQTNEQLATMTQGRVHVKDCTIWETDTTTATYFE